MTTTNKAKAGLVVWMTGISGAGKSTLAQHLKSALEQQGMPAYVLDGDVLRQGLNRDLGFSDADRLENMRRTAEVARLLAGSGQVVLVSLISPLQQGRALARQIISPYPFLEVYLNCPFEAARSRDVKGLYAKALRGEIKNFTGLDSTFEAPQHPDLELHTHAQNLEECTTLLLQAIHNLLT